MNNTERIKDMSMEYRPYEKCISHGAEFLTDAELLAVIIRTGTKNQHSVSLAHHILNDIPGCNGLSGLSSVTIEELMKINGIGKVKAIQIKCIAELSKRISRATLVDPTIFRCPKDISDYYMEDMRHRETESLVAAFLNTKHTLLKSVEITKGTVNASLMSAREIFIEALRYNAVFVVILHNHPSGDPTPSREDIVNTRYIREAGEIVGIELLDHIIIGDNKYYSLKEHGLLN